MKEKKTRRKEKLASVIRHGTDATVVCFEPAACYTARLSRAESIRRVWALLTDHTDGRIDTGVRLFILLTWTCVVDLIVDLIVDCKLWSEQSRHGVQPFMFGRFQ